MDLSAITIQPTDPELHYAHIARLISSQETEPTTAASLVEWYTKRQERGIRMNVALSAKAEVVGFNCLYRENLNLEDFFGLYLIVEAGFRKQGLGSMLYKDLLAQAEAMGARTLRCRVREPCEEGIRFATNRGFVQKKHSVEMRLDLRTWEDQHYDELLEALKTQGFLFTNMAELGDTQEARWKLYALNNGAAATDPGSNGIPPWSTFEEFELDVCKSQWYRPTGQIVAIDTHTGDWAAMSAITIFEGADHAYNLFTGTGMRYRGRKLAQAVKIQALRVARTFGVEAVCTSHNSENTAMIAIDMKLGYQRTPSTLLMVKELANYTDQVAGPVSTR